MDVTMLCFAGSYESRRRFQGTLAAHSVARHRRQGEGAMA
jgi:hypothetical protein